MSSEKDGMRAPLDLYADMIVEDSRENLPQLQSERDRLEKLVPQLESMCAELSEKCERLAIESKEAHAATQQMIITGRKQLRLKDEQIEKLTNKLNAPVKCPSCRANMGGNARPPPPKNVRIIKGKYAAEIHFRSEPLMRQWLYSVGLSHASDDLPTIPRELEEAMKKQQEPPTLMNTGSLLDPGAAAKLLLLDARSESHISAEKLQKSQSSPVKKEYKIPKKQGPPLSDFGAPISRDNHLNSQEILTEKESRKSSDAGVLSKDLSSSGATVNSRPEEEKSDRAVQSKKLDVSVERSNRDHRDNVVKDRPRSPYRRRSQRRRRGRTPRVCPSVKDRGSHRDRRESHRSQKIREEEEKRRRESKERSSRNSAGERSHRPGIRDDFSSRNRKRSREDSRGRRSREEHDTEPTLKRGRRSPDRLAKRTLRSVSKENEQVTVPSTGSRSVLGAVISGSKDGKLTLSETESQSIAAPAAVTELRSEEVPVAKPSEVLRVPGHSEASESFSGQVTASCTVNLQSSAPKKNSSNGEASTASANDSVISPKVAPSTKKSVDKIQEISLQNQRPDSGVSGASADISEEEKKQLFKLCLGKLQEDSAKFAGQNSDPRKPRSPSTIAKRKESLILPETANQTMNNNWASVGVLEPPVAQINVEPAPKVTEANAQTVITCRKTEQESVILAVSETSSDGNQLTIRDNLQPVLSKINDVRNSDIHSTVPAEPKDVGQPENTRVEEPVISVLPNEISSVPHENSQEKPSISEKKQSKETESSDSESDSDSDSESTSGSSSEESSENSEADKETVSAFRDLRRWLFLNRYPLSPIREPDYTDIVVEEVIKNCAAKSDLRKSSNNCRAPETGIPVSQQELKVLPEENLSPPITLPKASKNELKVTPFKILPSLSQGELTVVSQNKLSSRNFSVENGLPASESETTNIQVVKPFAIGNKEVKNSSANSDSITRATKERSVSVSGTDKSDGIFSESWGTTPAKTPPKNSSELKTPPEKTKRKLMDSSSFYSPSSGNRGEVWRNSFQKKTKKK